MTLFSSRQPNNDPEPWVNGHGVRIKKGVAGLNRNVFAPRPEFDHKQHNPVNPILVGIRSGENTIESALDMLHDDAREWWTPAITDGMIDHARRVLSRLARLAESEATR